MYVITKSLILVYLFVLGTPSIQYRCVFAHRKKKRCTSLQLFVLLFHQLIWAIPYPGGFKGFDKTIWEVAEYNKGDKPSITFKYYSKDGEEGTATTSFHEK